MKIGPFLCAIGVHKWRTIRREPIHHSWWVRCECARPGCTVSKEYTRDD